MDSSVLQTSAKRRSILRLAGVILGAMLLAAPGWASGPPAAHGQDQQAAKTKNTEKEKKQQSATRPRVIGGEIVVTAPRTDIPLNENPAATTVVEKPELSAMPRTVAADEALELVPGVKVDNQADGERVHLSIRGQGILTEHGIRGIKVLLDGLPLNDPTGFAPDLFDVDWATVKRIEVLRGPASALYGGGGSGGILNIVTDDGGPAPLEGTARLTMGSNGFIKALAEAGGSQDGVNYRFSASRTQGAGYRVHTAFQATNLYGKVRLRDVGRLHVTAIVAGTTFFNQNAEGLNIDQVHEDPKQPNPDALTFNEFQRTRRGTAGFVGGIDLADNQRLSFTVYGRHTEYRESVPSSVQHRAYDGYGGSLQYTLTSEIGSFTSHFNLGTDLDWQNIDDYDRPNLGAAREGAEILSDETIYQRGTGVFAFDELDLGHDWTLVFGARHDSIRNRLDDHLAVGGVNLSGNADFSKTTARAGIAWNYKPNLGFYASWGQGFLPPATEELANNPDSLGGFNQHLRPATSRSEEIGARGNVGDSFAFDVALFRLLTSDDFGRYRVTTRPLETFYRNAGFSRRYGVETLLSWFPIDEATVRLAYTYSDFKYDRVDLGDQVFHDTWLPNSPRHQAFLDLEYKPTPRLSLGASAQMLSRAYIDGSNATWIDGYTLIHARLLYRVTIGGINSELMLSGRNLTSTKYIAFTEPDPDGNSYQPGPRREMFAGVILHL
ncbi:MAG: TonB-dependent receptor [Acidobacteria bacterium]|nr:TonB-dependent receptor [Acidobacteriota bacterium]